MADMTVYFDYDWEGEIAPDSIALGPDRLDFEGKRVRVPARLKEEFDRIFGDRTRAIVTQHHEAHKRLAALVERNDAALTKAAHEEYAPGFVPPALERPTPTDVREARAGDSPAAPADGGG